jgi:HSP20 family protein
MESQVRRLLRTFFDTSTEPWTGSWSPPADVYRGKQQWLIKLDLAGVRAEDIQVHVEGQRLLVQGIRRDWSIVEDQQAYSMEIAYNRFQRAFELPFDLTQAEIRSEYRDGMLLVMIAPGAKG